MKNILRNQVINSSFFGNLFILPNGDILPSSFGEKIGNIYSMNLTEAVFNEISDGQFWKKARKEVEPCNNCIYNSFCPSISNYEYAIGKFNLCNINQ